MDYPRNLEMKKYILLISFLAVFGLSGVASASYTYSRSPAGDIIQNPVSITIHFDSIADTGCDIINDHFWDIEFGSSTFNFYPPAVSLSTLDYTFVADVPITQYNTLSMMCGGNGNGSGGIDLEGGGGDLVPTGLQFENGSPAFEVVNPPSGGFIPSDFASSVFAYIGSFFSVLSTPVYILIGIGLGLFIVEFIIALF